MKTTKKFKLKNWEFDSARISTNILLATSAELHFKQRWGEFFKNINLDEMIFTKPNLYVAIWNTETKNKCLKYLSENIFIIENIINKYIKENKEISKELKSIKDKIGNLKTRKNLLPIHERYIDIWGKQTIYTVIARFSQIVIQNKLNSKGLNEEKILQLVSPKYKGAQFYLDKELNKIKNKIIREFNKIPRDIKIEEIKNLTWINEEIECVIKRHGWIKSYINFYKEMKKEDLFEELIRKIRETNIEEKEIKYKCKKIISTETKTLLNLLSKVIDMKNEIQNTQAHIFYVGSKIYKKISTLMDIKLQEVEWLLGSEITNFLEGQSVNKEKMKKSIEQRKKGILIIPKMNLITSDKKVIDKLFLSNNINIKKFLKGDKGRKGNALGTFLNKRYIEGRAFLALSHKDLECRKIRKNDILITRAVTPEYTPYLNKFKAVISEEGGVASHSAIVAREMGIPMIVGATDATNIFEEGDTIILTDKGTVKKL